MVDVVQLVEHRIVVPSVVGSSPIIHPKILALPARFFYGGMMGLGQLKLPFFYAPPPAPSQGRGRRRSGGAPPALLIS